MVPKTARNILKPQEYVVTPQVFHDLHCVEMLRKFFWKAVNGTFVVNDAVRHVIPHYGQYLMNNHTMYYVDLLKTIAFICSDRVCHAMLI